MTEATNLARPLARGAGAHGTSGEMGPVVATLVLEGGRVGDELGGMALLELGSALAAVTSSDAESHACASTPATDGADEAASRLEPGRLGRAPHWIDDTPPRACSGGTASSSRHIATVVPGVRFPSLEALRAAVRRCALTRAALVPVAAGSPEEVAAALGASRAATCAAQVLAPGRKGVSRPALEAVGARLWDAGVGRAIAANRAWLESLAGSRPTAADATSERDGRDNETTNCEGTPNLPPVLPHYYVYPEGIMGEVAAWGMDSRARFRAIDAPNAMPPEQATLAVNAARVKPGDFVVDPCVGGGAVAFAAAALGATTVLGCDVDERALDAAREAARRFFRTETNGETNANANVTEDSRGGFRRVAFAKASLLEDPRVSEAYGGLENAVDAIVTDLPYGVRSAAAGVGDGPGQDATPASMLDALLVLARRSLRPSGRVAVWLRRAVEGGEGGEDEAFVEGAMSEARVAATCASFGFEVERRAAETRASGVQRALYVLTRNDFRAEIPSRDASRDDTRRAAAARRDREATDAAAHEARAAALVMHCMLRRNENHGRVAASGGQDIWRAAWTGDVAATRRLLSFSRSPKADGEEEGKSEEEGKNKESRSLESARVSRVLHAREPAGARNTPLTCAAMYGRNKVVALLLDLGADADGDHGDSDKKVAPDARRRSATHRAAERGAAETVAALLRSGGNPFVTRPVSANGGTAFHAAAERGHVEVFRLLLDFCRERDGNRGAEDRRKTRKASSLAAALAGEDDSGRTPALAAARRGHADVVTAALEALEETSVAVTTADDSDGDTTPPGTDDGSPRHAPGENKKASRATRDVAVSAAAEAARWGHVAAVRAAASFVDLSGASRRGRDALARLAFEAERWQRDDVRAFVASVASVPKAAASETKKRAPGHDSAPNETIPAVPAGASAVRADARSGAALFYARDFFRDPALVSPMLAAFEAAYLPRDHPLVTPADRKGERRAVPRDQAYYAARYVAREDAEAEAEAPEKENRRRVRAWFASYRYNPDRTQQPTPSSDPPLGLLALAAKVARATGQTCNHAVINRYKSGDDGIGAHADKDLDLERGSFVVSASFGAERVMTFRPRRNLDEEESRVRSCESERDEKDVTPLDETEGSAVTEVRDANARVENEEKRTLGTPSPETVTSARRALTRLLRTDPEWLAASEAKARAPPRSDAKKAAAARENARAAALRQSDPDVIAAAAAADAARRAWRAYADAKAFRVVLEHGSAVFFNMAFNERWTHAIESVRTDSVRTSSVGDVGDSDESREDEDGCSERDEDGQSATTAGYSETREKKESARDGGGSGDSVGERVGVTLRRCRVAFDPAAARAAPGLPRARRRDAWRGLRESMADVDAAEIRWREG